MELELIDRLGDDLREAGYDTTGVLDALGTSAHRALSRGEIIPALRQTGDGSALATLIRLFLLDRRVAAVAAAAALNRVGVDNLVSAGVLERDGDELQAALDIRPHAGDDCEYLVVSDLDSDARPGPVRPDHVLGIGSASLTLVRATVREPVDTVLDLGVGCGIQALHCNEHAGAVTGTDVNPRALSLAAMTARLNGKQWELLSGSMYEPVAGRQFDLVVSNPPFVISAGTLQFSYRDSGIAGDGLVQQLLAGLPHHLAPGGTAQLLANWAVHGDEDWRTRVGEWVAGTGLDGWVVQRELADPAEYVALWCRDAGVDPNTEDTVDTARSWLDYFEQQRVTGIGMGLITLRKNGSASPSVALDEIPGAGEDVTGDEAAAFLARQSWLAGTSDAELLRCRFAVADAAILEQRALLGVDGWSTVLRMLRRPGGPGAYLQLDEWTQGLLAGCRGEASLELQLDLFAAGHGFDLAALTAVVLPSVRHAVQRGLLHRVEP